MSSMQRFLPGLLSTQSQDEMIAETLAQMEAHNVVLGLIHDDVNLDRLRSKDFRPIPGASGNSYSEPTGFRPIQEVGGSRRLRGLPAIGA